MTVARITTGPITQAGNDPFDAPGSLVVDQANGLLHVVNSKQVLQVAETSLAVIQQQVALAAITAAQALFSKALAAGALNVAGRWVRVTGFLVYSTTSTNVATISLALKLGTVTLCTITTAATNTAASVNLPIQFEFDFCIPAGNKGGGLSAIAAHGYVAANIGTVAAAAVASYADTNVAANTITIGTNPAVGDTITVNGTLVTFIVNGGTPVGNQVALGVSATATATALFTFLAASADPAIILSTYTNPSAGVVLATGTASGFLPFATTSVPAKITFSTPAIDLSVAQTLSVTIAASAAVPSAQLQNARIEILA